MIGTLIALRDALASIPGVASSDIGIEANVAASDWPLIRIVPSRITPGRPYDNRTIQALIYFGDDITKSEGLAQVYANLLAMDNAIITKLIALGHRYIETLTDEDRFAGTYKMMAIRCELTGRTNEATGSLTLALDAIASDSAGEIM